MAENGKMLFEEAFDPFPTEDVFGEDDSCLDQKYRDLSEQLFGETEERMANLIGVFKEATKKKEIQIPGNTLIKMELAKLINCP